MKNSSHVNVAFASYAFASSTADIVKVVADAAAEGQEVANIRVDFLAGRIARAILAASPKISEAAIAKAIARGKLIVTACEPGRKAKTGQAMRTAEDQALFEPTKRWWSRVGRDAGVIKPRAPKAPAEGKADEKTDAKTPAMPAPFFAKAPKDASAAMLSLQNMLNEAAKYAAKYHKKLTPEAVRTANGAALEINKLAKEA
jgi:hypothetical protein